MSSIDRTLDAQLPESQDENWFGISYEGWVKIGIVAVLMAATFHPNLIRLWGKTNPFYGEHNWRHAICVPLIGIYYLFVHRDELAAVQPNIEWVGLGILLFGLVAFGYGIFPGQNDFIKDIGMVTSLFGVVTLLCGWRIMQIAWFPIVFLICALPWPDQLYSQVASPLQDLAAKVAVKVLHVTNVEAYNKGTKIIIGKGNGIFRTLNVAEACAGLRSLMTFISTAAAVAFLSTRPFWQKIIVSASAVPIAVFCNVMRVSGQGILDHYASTQWSEGFAHTFVGIVMLIPGFFFILMVGWLLDLVFVEIVDDRPKTKKMLSKTREKAVAINAGNVGSLVSANLSRQAVATAQGGAPSVVANIQRNAPTAAGPSIAPSAVPAAVQNTPAVAKPAVASQLPPSPQPITPLKQAPAKPTPVAQQRLVPPRTAALQPRRPAGSPPSNITSNAAENVPANAPGTPGTPIAKNREMVPATAPRSVQQPVAKTVAKPPNTAVLASNGAAKVVAPANQSGVVPVANRPTVAPARVPTATNGTAVSSTAVSGKVPAVSSPAGKVPVAPARTTEPANRQATPVKRPPQQPEVNRDNTLKETARFSEDQ